MSNYRVVMNKITCCKCDVTKPIVHYVYFCNVLHIVLCIGSCLFV